MAIVEGLATRRSPKYPRITLSIAIKHAYSIYNGAHRSALSADTAYRLMGFKGKTGASATALGALRQFGLVDGLRGDVRISETTLKILEPSSPDERIDALHDAANAPEAFKAIVDNFGENLPRSDDVIRSFLIRSLDFSKSGADDCIASFRETFSLVNEEANVLVGRSFAAMPPEAVTISAADEKSDGELEMGSVQSASKSNRSEFARIPLSKTCTADLRIEGDITRQALMRLIQHIELMTDIWAEEE